MSDILPKPGWNNIIEEKAGRRYTKKLNSAISELVDRSSLGSNPAQKIQRIANSLHRHYSDTSFTNKEIVDFIKTKLPSIKLKSEISKTEVQDLYTADNQWNSRYIDDSEQNTDTQPETPEVDNSFNFGDDDQNISLSPSEEEIKIENEFKN